MEWDYKNLLKIFSESNNKLLLNGMWGIEKESLRVTREGELALTSHPDIFGDKTINNEITTDFSESQVEIITPPFNSIEQVYNSLTKINEYVKKNINNELLWPLSMPCRLPEEQIIPIAKFNDSEEGKEKKIYRNGLAFRYGKKMQMISGIHYNFSFGNDFWDLLYKNFAQNTDIQNFKNNIYFSINRNILRYRWLLLYLFGASPVIDKSYEEVVMKKLCIIGECGCLGKYTAYTKYITSLRSSFFGYSNSFNKTKNVSFDNLDKYIKELRSLLMTRDKSFSRLGLFKNNNQIQLNFNILQKENEYYSPVRFKQKLKNGESLLNALETRGVEYLELRILDLNPFEENGINIEDLYFIHLFIIYCLFNKNNIITDEENKLLDLNHHLTSILGRQEDLELFKNKRVKIKLKSWAKEILAEIAGIAKIMDKGTTGNKFENSVISQLNKIINPDLLPSAMILNEMNENNESFIEFGLRHAKKYSEQKEEKYAV